MCSFNRLGNSEFRVSCLNIFSAACLWLTLGTGICQAADQKLSFRFDGTNEFTFDTGVVRGELQKDGAGAGLKSVYFSDPEVRMDNGNGLLAPYRFLTPQKRFGVASWEWPRTGRLLTNGNVQLRWVGNSSRPFNFATVYTWRAADTLDLTVFFTAKTDLDKFELFLASYFQKFTRASTYVQDNGGGMKGFAEAPKVKGDMQIFPRGADVLPVIKDGRWNYPPYPNHWAIRNAIASPLGMKTETNSDVTAIIMSPPGDCFAVSMSQQEAVLGAYYLSLFGKDLKDGNTLTGHARMVFGRNIAESQAVEKYAQYLRDLKGKRNEDLMSRDEIDSLRAFLAAPIAASLDLPPNLSVTGTNAKAAGPTPSVSMQIPAPGPDGWIKLFDRKQLYGCSPSVTNAGPDKISLENGCLRLNSYGFKFDVKGRDIMMRARVKKISGQNCSLSVRDGTNTYLAWFNGGNAFGIGKVVDRHYKDLTTGRSGQGYTGFLQMEVRAENQYLTLYVDGDKICEATDESVLEGEVGVQALKGIALFDSIEARVLNK